MAVDGAAGGFDLGGGGRRVELHLPSAVAVPLSLALSFAFVGSLHLWRCCGYEERDRNDPGTIRRRFVSTLAACALGGLLVCLLADPVRDAAAPGSLQLTYWELLGLWTPQAPLACLQSLLLTASLFAGPLLQHGLGAQEGYVLLVSAPENAWRAARDVLVAPLTEEFFFRACLVRLWDAARLPMAMVVFVGPLCFALAHTHHFVEKIRRHESKTTALVQVAFQVAYTSLFGMFASYVLLRTGSTWAAVLAHMFCNHQGFPDAAFFADKREPLHHKRHLLGAAYAAGMVAFGCLLGPLTAGFEPLFNCMSGPQSALS